MSPAVSETQCDNLHPLSCRRDVELLLVLALPKGAAGQGLGCSQREKGGGRPQGLILLQGG